MPTYNLTVRGWEITECNETNPAMIIAHANIAVGKTGDGFIEIPATDEDAAIHYGKQHLENHKPLGGV